MSTTHRSTETPGHELPRDIGEALQAYAPRLGMFAREVKWYAEIGSTNTVASALAERGAVDGAVVGSDMQTAGRGRHGRIWASPAGAGLYVSVILRPPPRVARLLTIAAGVSLADGIREASGLVVDLKWPNDVYLGGRKVAGILAEGGTSGAGVSHVVLGLGINVNQVVFPPDLAERATSLESEAGRPIDRGLVLACCLSALAARCRQLEHGRDAVLATWRAQAAAMLGRRVECMVNSRSLTGVAEDIDEQGALIVRTESERVRVISGEVIWR